MSDAHSDARGDATRAFHLPPAVSDGGDVAGSRMPDAVGAGGRGGADGASGVGFASVSGQGLGEATPSSERAEGPVEQTGEQPVAPVTIGELGGYRLIERLGSGGMGTVYSALDGGGNRVALKRIHPHIAEESNTRERLQREVSLLRRVRHLGVAQVLDSEVDAAEAFIVTELIEGPTLEEDVRAHGAFGPDELSGLAHGLAAALRAIHAQGIVHRDLKPSNVMLSGDGPVLIDFGIAQVVDDSRLTQTGMVTGTPGYVDPELIAGAEPHPEHDWWAWAAILLFAASGHAPFGSGTMAAVLARVAAGRADTSGAPDVVADALAAALVPDPARRLGPDDVMRVIDGHWSAADLARATSVLPVGDAGSGLAAGGAADAARRLESGDVAGADEAADYQWDLMPPSFLPSGQGGGGSDVVATRASGAEGIQAAGAPDDGRGVVGAQSHRSASGAASPMVPSANRAEEPASGGEPRAGSYGVARAASFDATPRGSYGTPGAGLYGAPGVGARAAAQPDSYGAPGLGAQPPTYRDSYDAALPGEYEMGRPGGQVSAPPGSYSVPAPYGQPGLPQPVAQQPVWLREPPRFTLTVLLIALGVSPLAAVRPGVAAVLALVVMLVLGAVGSSGRALRKRRRLYGRRASDGVRGLVRFPWDVVLSALQGVLGVLLGFVAGALMYYVGEGLFVASRFAAELTAWASVGVGVMVAWLMPSSYVQRLGARSVLAVGRDDVPGRRRGSKRLRAALVVLAFVFGGLVVWGITGGSLPVVWDPLPPPTPLQQVFLMP